MFFKVVSFFEEKFACSNTTALFAVTTYVLFNSSAKAFEFGKKEAKKARKTANSLQQLQTLINEGCDSIKLANGLAFSTSTPLVLENAENITIFAESSNCYINGNSIMPIVIKGKIKNVRFINFGIVSRICRNF